MRSALARVLEGTSGLKWFLSIVVFSASVSASAQTVLNITSSPYNASTGSSDNASAIQAAINACPSGGTVLVPSGTFLSGPLTLKSNMTFQIASGGELQMTPMGTFPSSSDFLYGSGLSNITINGSGVMDGQGAAWWAAFKASSSTKRPPAMIELSGCTGVTVEGLTVQNSPEFHIQFLGNGSNILASGLTITAAWPSPNTDGIDLRGTNVNIQNCYISDGDDVIQLGGSGNLTSGVTIRNCTFGTGHGLSIGGYTQAGVNNVLVDSCTFNGTQYGLRWKSGRDRGGMVSNLTYSNITMTGILDYPLYLTSWYPNSLPPSSDTSASISSTTPYWQNITFKNVTASAASGGQGSGIFWAVPEAPVSNVLFDGVTLNGPSSFDIHHARGVTFDCNCLVNGAQPPTNIGSFDAVIDYPSCGSNPTPTPTFTSSVPTPTKTNTPVPPTATFTFTKTNTPIPPTATFTFTATHTNTPLPPTATATFTFTATHTAVPPTATFTSTATNTAIPPTATFTHTAVPPTATFTSTSTNTVVPPTATFTHTPTDSMTATPSLAASPTATSTATLTHTAVPPTATFTSTATNTAVPPTATFTHTAVPPTATFTSTATNTAVPPTATNTLVPPTLTPTAVPPTSTATSLPPTATSTSSVQATSTPTTVPPSSTFTAVPPTLTFTSTATDTAIPPTATFTHTAVPPTATFTFTSTNTAVPPTASFTATSVPPTATFTHTLTATPSSTATRTAVPPTSTFTTVPPTATFTPVPPTATSTPTPAPPTATFTPTAGVSSTSFEVQLVSGVTSDITNSPHPQLQVVNTGSGPLNLNNVTLKYWFNCDCTNQTVQAWVDWAGLMPSGSNVTGNVQVSVQPTSLGGQTDYILYTFTGSMVLQPGQALQIQSRFNLSDWSNMSQANDWSFASYAAFTNWTHVTGYDGGALVWGQEPAASTTSALSVASAEAFPNPSTGSGTTLSFTLAGGAVDPGAKVTLKVYTVSGRHLWTMELTGASVGTSGQHVVFWNEKDSSGNRLANGVYLLKVTVESQGQKSSTIAKILILG